METSTEESVLVRSDQSTVLVSSLDALAPTTEAEAAACGVGPQVQQSSPMRLLDGSTPIASGDSAIAVGPTCLSRPVNAQEGKPPVPAQITVPPASVDDFSSNTSSSRFRTVH